MESSIPYFNPSDLNYKFPSKQSLTVWGIWSPNFWISSFNEIKSAMEPFAALARTSLMKMTSLWAVESSMQGTIVFGSESLFYSKRPLRACWRISLSVMDCEAMTRNVTKNILIIVELLSTNKNTLYHDEMFIYSYKLIIFLWISIYKKLEKAILAINFLTKKSVRILLSSYKLSSLRNFCR